MMGLMKKTPKPDLYFLGTVRKAQADWEHWMAEPEAAQQKTIDKKRAEQGKMAPRRCITGYVDELCVIDRDGNAILSAQCSGAPGDFFSASNLLISFFEANPDALPVTDPNTADDVGIRWFGFDIREVLANIAFAGMATGNPAPPGMWLYRPFTVAPFCDPYEILVPSSDRKDFALDALCEYMNLLELLNECNCAQAWAELARQLVIKANLVPM